MTEIVAHYHALLMVSAGVVGLMLIQLLTVDVAGLVTKHIPGTAVPQNHASFLFRANRAFANTNESIALYVLLLVLLIFTGSDPLLSGYAAMTFLGGRVLHSICYWFDLRIARSITFVVILAGLLWMFGVLLKNLMEY